MPVEKMLIPNSLAYQFDRYISHFDGNNHDRDDISALVISALLTRAAGLEAKSTYLYNNNLTEPNNTRAEKGPPFNFDLPTEMRKSAEFAEKLGIQTFDYDANAAQATQELVNILNSGEKILSFEGGPMEAIYRALQQVSPENLGNITLMSHSRGFNEQRAVVSKPGIQVARNWYDIIRDFPQVNLIQITNQNGDDGPGVKGFNSPLWEWMDESDDPLFQEARSLMENTRSNRAKNDTSDAGMLFYALTGNDKGNPLDAKEYLSQNLGSLDPTTPSEASPTPSQPVALRIEAENISDVDGYGIESNNVASGGQLLSLQGQGSSQGSVTFEFNKAPGIYDLLIGAYDENDGESIIELEVNNSTINTIELDKNLPDSVASDITFVTPTLGAALNLTPGDIITINGVKQNKEFARLDYIELQPVNI